MDSDYSFRYAELYRSHWWWRSRESLVIRKIAQLAPQNGWERALDVGCGDGLFLPQLSRFAETVEGLEMDESLVSKDAAERHTIHIGTLEEGFEPSDPYDFICMLDVLEHIENPLPALLRSREIIASGGVLLITVPAFQALWTSHDVLNHHYVRYRRRELAQLVEKAGFEAVESRYFFHWLALPKWVIGRTERVLGARLHHSRIPSRPLNALLGAVSLVEQSLFKPLPGFPGSSVLLVALARAPETSAGRSAVP